MGDEGTLAAYRESLVESLFSSMLNARFFEITQKADPPFLGAGSGQGRFVRSSEYFQLGAVVADGGIPKGMTALLTEAERVARHGFTATELEREKTNLLRSMEMVFTERESQPSALYADEFIRHFLHGESILGIEAEFEVTRSLLPGIGLDDVNALAHEWLVDENRVVLVSTPQREGLAIPTEAELSPLFAEAEAAEVDPYEDTTPEEPLLPEPPSPSPVVSEEVIPEVGVTEWTLANGVRVILKPTEFKEDQVLVSGFSPGGHSLSSLEDHMSATIAAQIVAMGGVGSFNMTDLQRKLTGKAVSISPSIEELTEGISGSASPKDLETLFQLIYLFFESPRKDATVFQTLNSQMEAFLPNRGTDPGAVFGDTLQVTLSQGHPRARPLTLETFREVELDEAFAFYQDRFADASDFTFVIVGAFELEEIRPLVETYLGGLPDLDRVEVLGRPGHGSTRRGREEGGQEGPGASEPNSNHLHGPLRVQPRQPAGDPGYDVGPGNPAARSASGGSERDLWRQRRGQATSRSPNPGTPSPSRSDPTPNVWRSWWRPSSRSCGTSRKTDRQPRMFRRPSSRRGGPGRPTSWRTGGGCPSSGFPTCTIRTRCSSWTRAGWTRVTPQTVQRDANLWLRLDNYVRVSLLPEGGRELPPI